MSFLKSLKTKIYGLISILNAKIISFIVYYKSLKVKCIIALTLNSIYLFIFCMVFLNSIALGYSFCEGLNLGNIGDGSKLGDTLKDGHEVLRAPNYAHTVEAAIQYASSTHVDFVSIEDYYAQMAKRGGGNHSHLDPFIRNLLEKLLLIEKANGLENVSIIDPRPIENPVCAECYRLFPIPVPGNDFYVNSIAIDNQFQLMYNQTRHNPLILYSYATFVQYNFIYSEWAATRFTVLPTVELLNEAYEAAVQIIQEVNI